MRRALRVLLCQASLNFIPVTLGLTPIYSYATPTYSPESPYPASEQYAPRAGRRRLPPAPDALVVPYPTPADGQGEDWRSQARGAVAGRRPGVGATRRVWARGRG